MNVASREEKWNGVRARARTENLSLLKSKAHGRCQEDVDRWWIREIVGDWCPYQGGEGFDESWNIFEKLMKLWSPLEFFHKNMSHDIYFLRDPHFVILAWVQSWNNVEILMKVCSAHEFFHKNLSHVQLLFTWSTFRDSSICTKQKHFWETDESL